MAEMKSLQQENIKKLNGKPLISYSISTALNSKLVSRVIVSTDHLAIAKISTKLGAEVPFLRPKQYSKDSSKTLDVIKHTFD